MSASSSSQNELYDHRRLDYHNITPLKNHQIDCVDFLSYIGGRGIIADEMGIGKSLESLAYLFKNQLFPAVIVSPATLKFNWLLEIGKHFGKTENVHVLSGTKPTHLLRGGSDIATGKIFIINYDILTAWKEHIKALRPRIIIADESAALRNLTARRTQTCLELSHYCDFFLALTGTPIQNHPLELYPVLNMIFRGNLMSYFQFRDRYCTYFLVNQPGRRPRVQITGGKNLQELHGMLTQKCLIRRQTKDVIDLPPFTRQSFFYQMNQKQRLEYEKMTTDFIQWLTDQYPDKKPPKSSLVAILTQFGYLHRKVAEWKIPAIFEWVDTFLENTEEKLLLFGIHHRVLDPIFDRYVKTAHAVRIDGRSSPLERQTAVSRINDDPKTRLFVGNIIAAGTGLTLTAATHTLFAELSYSPSDHLQAERRNLRISQTNKVFWHYAIVKDTIEERIAYMLLNKQAIFDQVIDGITQQNELKNSFNLIGQLLEDTFKINFKQ